MRAFETATLGYEEWTHEVNTTLVLLYTPCLFILELQRGRREGQRMGWRCSLLLLWKMNEVLKKALCSLSVGSCEDGMELPDTTQQGSCHTHHQVRISSKYCGGYVKQQ